MTAEEFQEGKILLIDKPLKWTSFDVVNKVRFQIRKKYNLKKIKVGHAGTLDPLATGLLILCTGKMTKQIDSIQSLYKVYEGTFHIGATTPSFDLETEVNKQFETNHISDEILKNAAIKFVGKTKQVPPVYSAIQKEGKRLYELARKGIATEIEAREIEIFDFEITSFKLPEISFRAACSKGTYIRSLANDFGKAIGSGAYLSSLKRTEIGEYTLANAQTLDGFLASF
ncbi:MAG: tRNA pseudouridine(55) synthase TruB [Flavobacteriales bacterium CG_4_9_14_3_um_filter_40_17]|nr:MAG: tRNA pseudouridine(55) synthase TruB [Flavobacteriales bacterium CG_4_9_14_3_um_filter_40_17]